MKVGINERVFEFKEEVTAFELRKKFKPLADIIILNGFPIKENTTLKDGDRISFIQRGEILDKEEIKSLMIARHTPGTYEALEKATVVIVGVGGLGSNIAISLARVGVGNLVLIDFDIVEPSNLNRQQYFMEDLGSFKVDAMKNIIEKINPFINVIVHKCFLDEGNIKEVIGVGDIVIEAVDNPESKALIANSTLLNFRDKYFIGSSGMAGYFSSNTIKTRKINSKFFLCGDEENEAKIGSGLMAPRVAIAANHMANMAVRILCKEFDI